MTTDPTAEGLAPLRQRAREQFPLWFAFGGGAAAWFVRLGLSYLVVPEVCRSGWTFVLHVITLVTLAIAVAASYLGYRSYRDAGGEGAMANDRKRFLGLASCFLSAFFAGVIVLESAPNLFIDPCFAAQDR